MDRLRIRAVEAYARPGAPAASLASPHQPKPPRAIFGLDFGTAFTKGVIQFERRFYVVDWSAAIRSEERHLIPSVFSESKDGLIVLGTKTEGGWKRIDQIKMRLLQPQAAEDLDAQCEAVIFIGAALRYAASWFAGVVASVAGKPPSWRLHLGLPAKSWDDEQMCGLFGKIAEAGRALAHEPGPITRAAARSCLDKACSTSAPTTCVMPEFACQLYSYLYSAQRQRDLHALVDIGAGTTDVAFFNVHESDGEDVLPMFSARVEKLGAHYLIGALAGVKGEAREWQDADSSATDDEVAERLCETPPEVTVRRRAYLNTLGHVVNESRASAAMLYPTSRVFTGEAELRLFLCGGGSNIAAIRERFLEMSRYASQRFGLSIAVIPLPRPRGLIGDLDESNYHRVAVAYGLSHLAADLGKVRRLCEVQPYIPQAWVGPEDRDASR
jgi:hypothetical protein